MSPIDFGVASERPFTPSTCAGSVPAASGRAQCRRANHSRLSLRESSVLPRIKAVRSTKTRYFRGAKGDCGSRAGAKTLLISLLAGCLVAVPAGVLHAAEPPQPADYGAYPAPVKKYLGRLYDEGRRKYAFREDYPGGFEQWSNQWRPELRRLLGMDKIAESVGKHQVKVQLEEPEDLKTYTRAKGWIETEPDVRIPFWLLRPKGEGPFPLAVVPHGHDSRGHDTSAGVYHDEKHRRKSLAEDRDVAVQAVGHGFLAIAPAVRGFSTDGVPDLRRRHGNQSCRSQLMHCLMVGRTAIGERVWDMERILDWACARPEVDGSRVLVMGNSGGGVLALYTAACDPRVTVAVASCSFCSLVSPAGYVYHCDCDMVPGILRHGELYDVAGLIAPRYLLAVNGRKDKLFVPTDVEHAAARVKAIFTAAGCPDHFEHRWGPEGHRFYKDLMWPFVLKALQR